MGAKKAQKVKHNRVPTTIVGRVSDKTSNLSRDWVFVRLILTKWFGMFYVCDNCFHFVCYVYCKQNAPLEAVVFATAVVDVIKKDNVSKNA